jgi:hypothetical protein
MNIEEIKGNAPDGAEFYYIDDGIFCGEVFYFKNGDSCFLDMFDENTNTWINARIPRMDVQFKASYFADCTMSVEHDHIKPLN